MACGKEQGKYVAAVTGAAAACSSIPSGVGAVACAVALYGVADALDDLLTCKERAEEAAVAAAVQQMVEKVNQEYQRLQQKNMDAAKK
jgi:hypothetical protein